MREVSLSNNETRTVRPLTRKEMKQVAHLGIDAYGFHPEQGQFDDAFDALLHTQFDDADLENLSFPDTRELFFSILAETWGAKAEEKNLSGSGPSDQTPNA